MSTDVAPAGAMAAALGRPHLDAPCGCRQEWTETAEPNPNYAPGWKLVWRCDQHEGIVQEARRRKWTTDRRRRTRRSMQRASRRTNR